MKKSMQPQTKPPEILISFRIPEDVMYELRVVSARAKCSTVPKFLRELIKQAIAKQ